MAMTIQLTDLDPKFVFYGGEGVTDTKTGEQVPERSGVGLGFNCPCGECGQRAYVAFENPIDGGPVVNPELPTWKRTGENFEVITLTPSIQRNSGCRWHGYLTNGEFKSV